MAGSTGTLSVQLNVGSWTEGVLPALPGMVHFAGWRMHPMRLFDSHGHLQDDRLSGRVNDAIDRARALGVNRMLCCGTREEDWRRVEEIADSHEGVIPAFGVHPWFASGCRGQWIDELRSLLVRHPAAAVGEIGLDHALDRATFAVQEELLIAQLRLAQELDRPVSIHCRRAWDRVTTISRHVGVPTRGGVLHAYSGSPELVPELEGLGFCISFSGSLTYDRNKRGRSSCAAVSTDRLLVETDSPDMTPVGASGNPRIIDGGTVSHRSPIEAGNEPANLPLIVQAVADARGVSVEEIAELTWRNAVRVFGERGLP